MQGFDCVFQCGMQDLPQWERFDWRETYFKNPNPIVLELGCGHGDYTIGLARLHPEINYIGVDIKGARMWSGARIAEAEQIRNVAFLRTNIELLPAFFAQDEVDGIWLTFPDPQMKKVNKRLTGTRFLTNYGKVLRPDGLVHLKTDSPFLYTYTCAMLKANHYLIVSDTDNLYAETSSEPLKAACALQTHYEHQWLERGMTIKYLCWQMTPKTVLIEPTIDIPKDNYRSYARNYVSATNH